MMMMNMGKGTKEDVAGSKEVRSKVIEKTKDLLEPAGIEQENDDRGTIDWSWGKEDKEEISDDANPNDYSKEDIMNTLNEDSDATVDMGDEEEVDGAWDTQQAAVNAAATTPSVTTDTKPTNDGGAETDNQAMYIFGTPENTETREEIAEETTKDNVGCADTASTTSPEKTNPRSLSVKKTNFILYESSNEGSMGDPELAESNNESGNDADVASVRDRQEATGNDCDEGRPHAFSTRRSSRARKPPEPIADNNNKAEEYSEQNSVARESRRTEKNKTSKELSTPPEENEEVDAVDEAEPPAVNPKPEPPSKVSVEPPAVEDLLRSTDCLFLKSDKDSVTVADICRALSSEFSCKLTKANKKCIREHLIDLMRGKVKPQVAKEGDDEDEGFSTKVEEDQVSEQGDEESDGSDVEKAPSDSDEEYEEKKQTPHRQGKSSKKDIREQESAKKSAKPKRPNQRKAAKAARKTELDRLRKKRMEELRIRNEEMQLNQSKAEQERAEAIAARFETNTDELRLKRLEDRLTLLELLDKKRIAVIDTLEAKIEDAQNAAAAASAQQTQQNEELAEKPNEAQDENEESSSEEEEELDIVGISKPLKPLKPLHTHFHSTAVTLLKEVKTPQAKPKKHEVTASKKHPVSLLSPSKLFKASSPTKRRGTRAHLQQALRQKQRKQGNLWLARELGYKTEEDHLRDCQLAAEQKRTFIRKMEQARVKANERKLLRERILRQDEGGEEGDQDEEKSKETGEECETGNSEDEEMNMARELEAKSENKIEESNASTVGALNSSNGGQDSSLQHMEFDAKEKRADSNVEEANDTRPSFSSLDDENAQGDSQQWETQHPIPWLTETDREGTDSPKEQMTATEAGKSSVPNAHVESKARNDPSAATETEVTSADDCEKENHTQAENISSAFEDSDDENEMEFVDEEPEKDPNRPRNAGWQAMLKKEAEMLKKQKRRKQGLVEDQAEEEEEEEVAGLEDFGFSVKKKTQNDDDEDAQNDELDEDDLKHVVDDVSDDEGDEEAGAAARKKQERRDEKERHKEIMRRMREGYDGRRGGVAGGVGARGMHRFDQLVAADNREDARRLGLLNDDELDSDNDDKKKSHQNADDEDDEVLLDNVLKNRFLHRSDVAVEENFSEDEEEQEEVDHKGAGDDSEAEEERTQERLAKRFAKRARMQRLEEEFADSQEFSQQRLIDEDESMREELSQMKNGLLRKRSTSTSTRSSISSHDSSNLGQKGTYGSTAGCALMDKTGNSLSIALRASRKGERRTTFLGGNKAGKAKANGALIHKSVALSHVVFTSSTRNSFSKSDSNMGGNSGKRKTSSAGLSSSSLFQKVARKVQ